jgi:hypothetical protein
VPTFKKPSRKDGRFPVIDCAGKYNPGPGTYSPSRAAVDMSMKYPNKTYKLYKEDRKIVVHDKTKKDIPGPGQYALPSAFKHLPLAQIV